MANYPKERCYCASLAHDAIDAGVVVIPAAGGGKITVTDYWMKANGATDTCTGIIIEDEAAVVVGELLAAGLGSGVVARAGIATNGTTTTNLGVALTAGKGVQVITDGSPIGTATSVIICITYIRSY